MVAILKSKLTAAETDVNYLTSHFAEIYGTYHNMLRDMSTACGLQLIGVQSDDVKPTGEPRCSNCVRAVDAVLTLLHPAPSLEAA